jgi:hypothetical protein
VSVAVLQPTAPVKTRAVCSGEVTHRAQHGRSEPRNSHVLYRLGAVGVLRLAMSRRWVWWRGDRLPPALSWGPASGCRPRRGAPQGTMTPPAHMFHFCGRRGSVCADHLAAPVARAIAVAEDLSCHSDEFFADPRQPSGPPRPQIARSAVSSRNPAVSDRSRSTAQQALVRSASYQCTTDPGQFQVETIQDVSALTLGQDVVETRQIASSGEVIIRFLGGFAQVVPKSATGGRPGGPARRRGWHRR